MNKELLDRFFAGKCTAGEVEHVLSWFKSEGIEEWQHESMRALWEEIKTEKSPAQSSLEQDIALALIHEQIRRRQESIPGGWMKRSNDAGWSPAIKMGLSIAAAVVIAAVISVFFPGIDSTTDEVQAKLMRIETGAAEKRTVTLSDGSTVVLNGRTSLSFPEVFASDKRELTLSGEAFFNVAKDKKRPFTVKTGAISTTAVGTSFNIQYRPERKVARVSLASGIVSVAMSDENQPARNTRLDAGQQIDYDLEKGTYKASAFDPETILSWREGKLVFKKADFEEVVGKIQDMYGVQINLKGDRKKLDRQGWTFTGTFEKESLEGVLEGISYIKDLKYKIEGKQVTIEFTDQPEN